ncbi:MAG: 1-acyl-sn-glycerol-3-phosphate acyltransferase [Fimbriimonadales bacterium]|nr:1-acyl-sn-glycerol-3-phosphate acyltransferase [Fimbriimonadales bacterium]
MTRVLFQWVLYPVGKALLAILLLLFGPVVIENRRAVPRKGPLLVLANHISDCDPPVIGYALPRPAYFMAKAELFSIPILAPLIRALRAFPVRRGAPDKTAIRTAVELLQKGEAVVIFPEGHVSETGTLQPLQPGAALILRRAPVPVICCGVINTNRIIPFRKIIPRPAFRIVRVRFGEPRTFPEPLQENEFLQWAEKELRRLTAP